MNGEAGQPDLTGRVAVVTGAGGGLGRDIALGLANRGAAVALAGRTLARVEDTAAAIEAQTGRDAIAIRVDVSVPAEVEELRLQTEDRLGPAGVLVNAAGIFGPLAPLVDCPPDEWIATLMIAAVGPYLTSRTFAPAMIADGWGRIVNVSSAGALLPPIPYDSAYVTGKAALNQLTRQLAVELEGTGVTVNAMHPGSLKTEMWEDIRDQARRLPDDGGALGEWVELVERTGGDSVEEAVALALRLVAATSDVNGGFHWPQGGHQDPIPSWQ